MVSNQRPEQSGYDCMMLMMVFLTMCSFLAMFTGSESIIMPVCG